MKDDINRVKTIIIERYRQIYSKDLELYGDKLKTLDLYEGNDEKTKKVNIKETFGFYRQLKDGTEGKQLLFPDIEEMHSDPKHVRSWVEYSTFDAEITFFLRETLFYQLT